MTQEKKLCWEGRGTGEEWRRGFHGARPAGLKKRPPVDHVNGFASTLSPLRLAFFPWEHFWFALPEHIAEPGYSCLME